MGKPHETDMAPRAYESDGAAIDAAGFIQAACDPRRSVVVEACAGSGKTWLLVARMLRLLLAGAEPAELLAITFTRKAAQEMRERLVQLLHELALADDATLRGLLLERGVAETELPQLMPAARGLYERVLASPQSLSIDTFHSWFARLLQVAPLSSEVPHGYQLTESTSELMDDAYARLMQELNQEERAPVKAALKRLYELAGDWNARRLLNAFMDRRAEWWALHHQVDVAALDLLQELCGEDAQSDARLGLWQDDSLCDRIRRIASLLGKGAKRNQERAVRIETVMSGAASEEAFARLLNEFCDDKDGVRGNDHRRGQMLKAIETALGADGVLQFEQEFEDIARELLRCRSRACERRVIELNRALFDVGAAYLDCYQAVKAEQRVFDFGDLEWHAYRLLTDDAHAAYIHGRLDARYRHILLDEFQDTNPLQWSVIRAWLDAYGDDAGKPSVFIVGDPKQSIYRFRRAEPRIFRGACELLAAGGAAVLRTNQTRRNAGAVVELLNASFRANPIFSPQTTLVGSAGMVWRLLLVQAPAAEEKKEEKDAVPPSLRDPLNSPREEQEDGRRYEEGLAVARAILHARETLAQQGKEIAWSDVMLLVKKRAYLGAYESALREAGVPFLSDKRGGLLESLEVADLIALLTFLITPGDNRALAHALKSPIFGATDDDLILLARRTEGNWWTRLQAAAQEDACSQALRRACRLLGQWWEQAPHLPVHDLLDMILHQGQLLARYAQTVPAVLRSQVIGNIEAFTELALGLDSGRYPSLPKFIEALRVLRRGADSDAPDEASIDAAADAVRIMTIHSAKGLEAAIVVLLDANHSDPARDDLGILCDWPHDSTRPGHFSAFGRRQERGIARDPLFEAEEGFKTQEDWNLLYVAMTRAKDVLIVSGVAGGRGAEPDGSIENSWYARLRGAPELVPDALPPPALAASAQPDAAFALPLFNPPLLAPTEERRQVSSEEMEEGIALHVLMERVTDDSRWPPSLPDTPLLARWLSCPEPLARVVRGHALTMLRQPELERFFNPDHFRFARNEMEIVSGERLLRLDRVVVFEEEVWVLDYKRDVLESELAAYRVQLAGYREALAAVFPGMRVRGALVTYDGRLWEMDA
ncbi:DNA helicase/exodeoxyribonuclease V, subunit A [Noviherbaspirillum humi]|uniref:DNA 3'-5' helicase n=1 Tax=Noviherbaspirillum humi TaxID=1688639 RepID=A0A239IY38_9BURK|nr:UvrD-helicase domain-containing protein [Noviherbaspirillum humi]SNS98696.1 DNA helicase/exodeoxyribonuclease V, subunit A [Noviherbaspirillum humi]